MRAIAQKMGLCTLIMFALLICGAQTPEQGVAIMGRVEQLDAGTNTKLENASGAVVWFTREPGAEGAAAATVVHQTIHRLRLVQHNKSFEPSLLVVPVGSEVEFPNQDPFFHNVFSLFQGKRFDLGLYEAGSTRNVLFDRPGISYIFCNIHPEMSAVVIALDTPYYGVSDQHGEFRIPGVPPGRYVLHVWHQSASPEMLDKLTREIEVSQISISLGVIRLTLSTMEQTHKNKYGRDYDRPDPASPVYDRP
jgi:plastocyanin